MSWDKILKILAGVAGAIAGLFGEWNTMLTVLVVMMATDYISGWIVAWCGKSPKTEGGGLSSKVGFIGIAKKGFIMLLVLLATLLDRAIGGETSVFQSSLVLYYIANEGLSVLENAALLGVPFPDKLKRALETLREKEDPPDRDRIPDD
ncbi:MAG: phage holin family protein [Clostridia bacterium]|nr:phage holin family protein [Clostridia bacterium]